MRPMACVSQVQPYEYAFQNYVDSWLYACDILLILLACAYTLFRNLGLSLMAQRAIEEVLVVVLICSLALTGMFLAWGYYFGVLRQTQKDFDALRAEWLATDAPRHARLRGLSMGIKPDGARIGLAQASDDASEQEQPHNVAEQPTSLPAWLRPSQSRRALSMASSEAEPKAWSRRKCSLQSRRALSMASSKVEQTPSAADCIAIGMTSAAASYSDHILVGEIGGESAEMGRDVSRWIEQPSAALVAPDALPSTPSHACLRWRLLAGFATRPAASGVRVADSSAGSALDKSIELECTPSSWGEAPSHGPEFEPPRIP